jgi:hypothetical protein
MLHGEDLLDSYRLAALIACPPAGRCGAESVTAR